MKNVFLSAICAFTLIFSTQQASAQGDIVDVALGSKDHTTLVAALKAADLVSALKAAGPFTVFAPTNDAFSMLPEGTLDMLLKPENKAKLAAILKYHVIKGKLMAKDVLAAIEKGKGTATVKTLQGGSLSISLQGNTVVLKDENGAFSKVSATDLSASNGVIHVITSVVTPK